MRRARASAQPAIATCFKARLAAMSDADGGLRNAEPACDECFKRFIGAASFRESVHARLQHALARMIFDADDFIAGIFRRQPRG
jgi:hypothetical protein